MIEAIISMFFSFGIFFLILILSMLKQINQYEQGVKFTMGRYTGTMSAGWRLVIPVFQHYLKVDMRIRAVDVPFQKTITEDNVPVSVNAVIYYKVSDAPKAILEVENYEFAVSQLAQTTMRNVAGEVSLDDLLSKRDKVAAKIKNIVDLATDAWGIEVSAVELKDIVLPEEMERTIAKQAEAEREKRAVIIKAKGEAEASMNMAKAAEVLSKTPGALHLRTLQSMNDISSDQSNTIVFTVPVEILNALAGKNKK